MQSYLPFANTKSIGIILMKEYLIPDEVIKNLLDFTISIATTTAAQSTAKDLKPQINQK